MERPRPSRLAPRASVRRGSVPATSAVRTPHGAASASPGKRLACPLLRRQDRRASRLLLLDIIYTHVHFNALHPSTFDLSMSSRRQNERKFGSWRAVAGGGRLYWRDFEGKMKWWARYLKEVDSAERTVRFWQEIYDERGVLVEVHEKFPIDRGHEKKTK